jgi:HD-GYP domain-containing protein (c-di-GMP phosphodiesterase class II)
MPQLTKLNILDVTPGLFVVAISKQNGNVIIEQPGWIKSELELEHLKDKGVTELTIDLEKTLPLAEKKVLTSNKLVRFSDELPAAKQAFDELFLQLEDTFKQAKDSQLIDVVALQNILIDSVDSLFRNSSVLLCLTNAKEYKKPLVGSALRSALYFGACLKSLDWSTKICNHWMLGALLHNIGKTQISINKDEFTDHIYINAGIKLLKQSGGFNEEVLEVLQLQRERINGSGVPAGVSISELNPAMRLFSIIVEYETLTQSANLTPEQAFRNLLTREQEFDFALLQLLIKIVGLYPPGSLVELSNGKVGIVLEHRQSSLQPKVKLMYDNNFNRHINAKVMDLTQHPEFKISGYVDAKKLNRPLIEYL